MDWLSGLGYWGLFIGSFLSSTIIPFSADVLLVAMLAMKFDPWICLAVATAGNWAGGMTSYGLGWLGKWQWIERWLKVSREKLTAQQHRIERWGSLLAFFAWLPVIGDVFAIALGFYRINPRLCALYMFIGRLLRFTVWILLYQKWGEDFIRLITK